MQSKKEPADVEDLVRAIVRHEGRLRRRAGKRERFVVTPRRRTVVYIADLRVRSA